MGPAGENIPEQLFQSERNAISNESGWLAFGTTPRANEHPANASCPGANSANSAAIDNAAATNSTTAT